jgi:alpha-N-arabinofuranosidase
MPSAHLVIDPRFVVGAIDRRLFGSFVEHLGRCVYDGLYEPGHPSADADGFRQDVLALVRELGVTTIRYPGGNFVSGFRWEDSIGARERRPARLDLAWHSTETNEIGLDEFARWTERAGAELMYAVNLGTRGVLEALDVLEYANVAGGSAWSDARRANGREEPYGITMWCLGNEMDGPWQLGHRSAEDYGKVASQAAKAMKQLDPSVQLVVCGSSGAQMPTFGDWERVVLEHTYDDVEFISCHAYYQEHDGDTGSFLASALDMDHFIESVIATADAVQAKLRREKPINISFDEWNVWYQTRHEEKRRACDIRSWPVAPRLLEDRYCVLDAVVVGNLLISLLRHADRVTAACLAQLVNVIAPIMTEPGGPAWRQTTFFPFATTARLARGKVVGLALDTGSYETKRYGQVPLVDAVATHDAEAGRAAVFLVNRGRGGPAAVTVDLAGFGGAELIEALTLADAELNARNTLEQPQRVGLAVNASARAGGTRLTIELPAVSWTAISLSV